MADEIVKRTRWELGIHPHPEGVTLFLFSENDYPSVSATPEMMLRAIGRDRKASKNPELSFEDAFKQASERALIVLEALNGELQ